MSETFRYQGYLVIELDRYEPAFIVVDRPDGRSLAYARTFDGACREIRALNAPFSAEFRGEEESDENALAA